MTNGKSSKRALRGDISTSTGSDTMSRDAESTEMAADQQAPDGGWGWMIVFAVFVGNFLIDGCAGSFGILYPELLEEFDASPAMTSMAGSLIVAVYLFSSPLVGSLVNQFGCRPVCFAGGLITAVGFILSITTDNIVVFLLTFGVLGGLGLGFNSLTGHVMVNSYFHKKRGIAGGIVSSGAGFGVFVCAPLLQYLIYTYAWRGAVLVFSGVMLQFCVCAMLMRPLNGKRQAQVSEEYNSDVESETGYVSNSQTHSHSDTQEKLSLIHHENETCKTEEHGCGDLNEVKNCAVDEGIGHTLTSKADKFKEDLLADLECFTLDEGIGRTFNLSTKSGRGLNGWFLSTLNIRSSKPWAEVTDLKSLPDISKYGTDGDKLNDRHRRNRKLRNSTDSSSGIYINTNNYGRKHIHLPPITEHIQTKPIQPLSRKDIFYSGSLHHLQEFQNADNISSFIHSMIIPTDELSVDDDIAGNRDVKGKGVTSFLKKCVPKSSRMCDCSIFSNSVYIPMLLGGVFIQMGQFIPSTFIPEYCDIMGLNKDQISTLLSIFGGVNILGRLSAGALANVSCISPLWVCNIAMFMCAVCCALFPFCTSFVSLCVFSVGFGYFIGFFPPLQVLIMVKYLGLDRLSSSVGFLQMAKGPAALIGPPLAGVVYEWTSDYAMSMEFAAFLFFLSAIVQSLVPLIDRCTENRKENTFQVIEVEILDPETSSTDQSADKVLP